MDNPTVNRARSLNGCWTCRVRKKKCDERRPSCLLCHSLQLDCQGYGPRPEWMDNSTLQKAQALKIKDKVRQTQLKRQRQHSPCMDQLHTRLDLDQDSPPGLTLATASTFSSISDGEPLINGRELYTSEVGDFGFQRQDSLMSGFDEHIWASSLQDDLCSFDPFFSLDDPGVAIGWPQLGHPPDIRPSAASQTSGFQPNLGTITRHGDSDDVLLMHYLDEVFYIQYPFYNHDRRLSRGWLLSAIRQAKSTYYATLALSQRHINSTRENSHGSALKNIHDDQAMQEFELSLTNFHAWRGEQRLVRCTQELTCISQLLFSEVLSGGMRDWRLHFAKAAPLISALFTASMDLSTRIEQLQQKEVDTEDEITTQVILGTFIVYDTLCSASIRSRPSLTIDHITILNTSAIDIRGLFGIKNWVIASILEIVVLDNWKKEAEKDRRLSIVELVKRSAKIEQDIQQKIKNIEATKLSRICPLLAPTNLRCTSSAAASPMDTSTELTKIFALAALTYLHVVVSGAHAELPEITESVSKTILALQKLSDLKLLRHLAWPFCVSGCLALEVQQSFFRDLICRARAADVALGTCSEAFKVTEQCWEWGNMYSYNCDWAFIMDRRGINVPLI